MSYKTYVDKTQIFGNNKYYPEWLEFIKSHGIDIDEDYGYDGYISDIMGAIETIEKIVMRLEKEFREQHENDSLFDFRETYEEVLAYENDKFKSSLLDKNIQHIQNSYLFMPYAFLVACSDKIKETPLYSHKGHLYCYELIEPVHVYAS